MLAELSRAHLNIFSVMLWLSYASCAYYFNNVNRHTLGFKNTTRGFPVSGGFSGVLVISGVLGGRGVYAQKPRGYLRYLRRNISTLCSWYPVMWFFIQNLSTINTISLRARKCSTLLTITVCTLKCQVKGKQKKRTPCSLEWMLGLLGNESYVLHH